MDPTVLSGLPASLLAALRSRGAAAEALPARLPGGGQRLALNALALAGSRPRDLDPRQGIQAIRSGVRGHKPRAEYGKSMYALRSAAVRWAVRRARVDVCIQFGSECRLPRGLPFVTLDDATIAQLRRSYPYPWMQAVAPADLDRLVKRQIAIYRAADACCFISHWAARSAVDDYGISGDKVVVVGAGSNLDFGGHHGSREWGSPRFLFVGKDWQRKNGAGVLAAFSQLRAECPEATLDVVGGHPPIRQDGVTGHGLLSLDDEAQRRLLSELYRSATCFVMPSRFEPAGYVFAEALNAGLPCIGTDRGGSGTLIGDAGVTLDPDDDRALLDAMRAFADPAEARRLHDRARARATLFTWEAVSGRLLRAVGWDAAGEILPDFL